MKPVQIQNKVAELKAILHSTESGKLSFDLHKLLGEVEQELKAMDDVKESKLLLGLLTLLILPLAAYLIYLGFYWPSLIAVSWIGALVYYNVNERSLSIATLREKAKITPHEYGSKVSYLLAGVQQKQDRLSLVRIYNYTFWPFAVFMGQLILNQSVSSTILWLILGGIFLINTIFWYTTYKPQFAALQQLEQSLHDLSSRLILQQNESSEPRPLYDSEEE